MYNNMKKICMLVAAAAMMMVGCKQNNHPVEVQEPVEEGAVVYMTNDISPEALIKIYEALGVKAEGRVAVKISTGEAGGHNYLKPELIGDFVKHVNGKLVECNTTYAGQRRTTEQHLKVIEDHGFNTIGGVLKNQSIGVASANGKAYIHSNGRNLVPEEWINYAEPENQDKFLECMANAAAAVHDYFKGKVLYINVMNNMSIDCDCNGNPKAPELKDMGILASTDPVALDQASLDLVYQHQNAEGDDATSLIQRVEKQHGVHTIEHAEKIGLGSRKYHIVNIDEQ